jgi:carbonic anhydrase
VNDAVENGEIKLHGWYFDIRNGNLMSYDTDIGQFKDVKE